MDISNAIDIESKINEAEVCRSMGLQQDAIMIYEKVLAELPTRDTPRMDQLKEQIGLLKAEIAKRDKVKPADISGGDINILIDQLPEPNNPSAIFVKASAFLEMGMYEQAVAELVRFAR